MALGVQSAPLHLKIMQTIIDQLRAQLSTARLVAQALARENAELHARLASATATEGNALATLARLAAVKH